jgi:hypothetical protein
VIGVRDSRPQGRERGTGSDKRLDPAPTLPMPPTADSGGTKSAHGAVPYSADVSLHCHASCAWVGSPFQSLSYPVSTFQSWLLLVRHLGHQGAQLGARPPRSASSGEQFRTSPPTSANSSPSASPRLRLLSSSSCSRSSLASDRRLRSSSPRGSRSPTPGRRRATARRRPGSPRPPVRRSARRSPPSRPRSVSSRCRTRRRRFATEGSRPPSCARSLRPPLAVPLRSSTCSMPRPARSRP